MLMIRLSLISATEDVLPRLRRVSRVSNGPALAAVCNYACSPGGVGMKEELASD